MPCLQIRQIEFEKAISVGDTETSTAECRRKIADGACPMPTSYTGPLPTPPSDEQGEGGRWKLTKEFVESMISWFKDEKPLPKRLVWEIVLQCHDALKAERSLVEVDIPEGMTVDVIGDTHGASC